ncbi:hypothetical protein [Azorhizobium caulinodans]|uniref:hypothetical protein n=1 Tax=Azorhizobium caulinodans TaxID=7 RepID=UPI0013053D29|nr:hypothetical protein [Azorhizobium caulinodans]
MNMFDVESPSPIKYAKTLMGMVEIIRGARGIDDNPRSVAGNEPPNLDVRRQVE